MPERPIFTPPRPCRPTFSAPSRHRETFALPKQPEWNGVFVGWAHGWVHKNYWKVQHIFPTKEDAVQECAVLFAVCLQKYYYVTNPRHFMSLFTITVVRKWVNYAKEDTAQRDFMIPMNEDNEYGETAADSHHWDNETAHNDGAFYAAMASLSNEAHEVLEKLVAAPAELISLLFESPRSDMRIPPRIEINRRLRRFFGIKSRVDIMLELENLAGVDSARPPMKPRENGG
jgi:hypothetical protein